MSLDADFFRSLSSIPGFPMDWAGSMPDVAEVMQTSPGGGDEQLYGSPGSYAPAIPAPMQNAGVVRTHGGIINPEETRAGIIRALERDFQSRFAPIENVLVDETTNKGAGLNQDLARTRRSVTNAAANSAGQRRRQMGRFGIARRADPDEKTGTVSNAVAGARDTRLRVEDRRMGLLGGSSNIAAAGRQEVGG